MERKKAVTTGEDKVMDEETAENTATVELSDEQVIAMVPKNIRAHHEQGKAHFETGRYQEAQDEFEAILKIAPGNIETRIWLQRTKDELAKSEADPETASGGVKPEECVWMKLGVVSHQICTRNHDCITCKFDRMMHEKITQESITESDTALGTINNPPDNSGLCHYAAEGIISYRLCTHGFQCATCEFGQTVEDTIQRRLAELASRRDSLAIDSQKETQAITPRRLTYEELLSLNEELNSYIEQLRSTQRQLVQTEKMDALGQLSSAIAHEINNPLAGALTYTKLLSKKMERGSFNKDETITSLLKIEEAVTYCSVLVHSLLDFASQTEPVLQPVEVNSIIAQVVSMVDHQAQIKGIKVSREEITPLPVIMADSKQLRQVFVNLAANAIEAMSEGGKLTVSVSLDEDGDIRVSFRDTGCGIAPENMDELFTPFFHTKKEVRGVGLGLSVAHGIIERHGGRIEVESEVGKGSTFTVYLPVSA
ncbi:MAG: tetratricopeptide repeat protein [Dehalococcoidales bacterium]|nr:MAG: tetratricopeptide repeat protein [Dehalococcoidales bacterium]